MKFQRQIKKVKSLIRGHDAVDLLEALYKYMNAENDNDMARLGRYPWLIMFIVKWNLLENRVHPELANPLTNRTFNKILTTAYDLGGLVKMPGENSHYRNFMRNIAYQQFIYQKQLSSTTVASNHLLFSALPDNHRIRTRFQELTGVEINDFNKCCLVIYAAFLKSKSVSISDFEIIFEKVGRDNLEKTLNTLSIDLHRVKSQVQDNDYSNGTYSEWYEQTPFLRFPLVKYDNKYTCLNHYVLLRSIEGYVYDLLKNDNPQSFMGGFGKVFEAYLYRGLNFSSCEYIDENVLKGQVPEGVNVIDFIVTNDNSNIFIDAKAVELPYLGKVSDNPKVILGKVKTSALKAIKQANVLNDYLLKNGLDSVEFKSDNYLLVVTYKELYLGNGADFYESVAKAAVDEITRDLDSTAVIPLENMYFITLEEFDLLCSVVNCTDLTLEQVLAHAKKNDSESITMKFDFTQHINSLGVKVSRPDYLDEAVRQLTDLLPE
ncbi:GapS1 family protein [Vibrio crassostreae]|uniref:GapS1 family protein n=1 Tax=Vibrio crassostreae TaxID=246167 RepID=UPI000F46DC6B|nr:hypothetical protein [Vibrio crassostreae]ROP11029.1 hypothetical protein EDB33_12011 [Vibrio crassostreae]ROP15400.1 hypothetical protein EDB34_12079 [Vibrio crassostreae]RPE88821.1 hypothetical protein EDB15_12010 [Vibrio crassostreae]TCN63012.1 hypothetical protein EDB60_11979 [Vibrio crassostreae]TCV13780.1 hypothetical protein EDB16_10479 [Vibrio crassostreae]